MISFEILKFYLSLNFGIGIAAAVATVAYLGHRQLLKWIEAKWLLHTINLSILSAIAAAIFFVVLPQEPIWQPMTQIWSGVSAKGFPPHSIGETAVRQIFVSIADGPLVSYPSDLSWIYLVFLISGALVSVIRLLWNLIHLNKIWRNTLLLRRIGNLEIRLIQRSSSPFSFALFGRAVVVVPEFILLDPESLRLSIQHELQHHRQRDHIINWILILLKALCWWNPMIWILQRQLSEIQEMACDEAVIGRHHSAQAYGRCLLWVARMTSSTRPAPIGTVALAGGSAAHKLRRRILIMFDRKEALRKRSYGLAICATVAATIWLGMATASASLQDRRMTLDEARRLAENTGSEDFPITINKFVLNELNRYLGTPDGRKFMQESISRMQEFEPMIVDHLIRYRLPRELAAVPLIESGYQNLAPNRNPHRGAGLWMFVAPTARRYGLKVQDEVDERLDPRLETEAAMRYLSAVWIHFKSWDLALMAYNAGEGAVSRGIARHGTRDAWELIGAGVENDKNYLAKIMAAAIILANPKLLN